MKSEDLKSRTKAFALRVIKLSGALSHGVEAQVIGKQVLRSGTSVGAHYREAQRAKSTADFASKTEGALQELDETSYWLELLEESGIFAAERLSSLRTEAEELTKIFVTIAKQVKHKSTESKK
jgi:four helix bundle protein